MVTTVLEKTIHKFRQILAIGWLLLIFAAFYDPLSLWLTDPNNLSSPIRIDQNICVSIQGKCLTQAAYVLAPRIFWGMIVPLSIATLVFFGHESWRRICPLSFFSQIPRQLGIGRKVQKISPTSGIARRELVGVAADSWLGKNYLYLQLCLLYLGLNIRILFTNGNGAGLGTFLLVTIGSSIIVGYLFKGKSWCQYFCPMAPVELFFTGTRGVLGSDAHVNAPGKITQSMCRSIDSQGTVKSACVGCQSSCIDIDIQHNYWDKLAQPDRQLLFYGYFGLMVGFFSYFYLYTGNWDYYYSGAWSHDPDQLSSLFDPGFYILGKAISIPKIVAVPLTLGVSTAVSYFGSQLLEKICTEQLRRRHRNLDKSEIRHRLYSFWVFISFNIFFEFVLHPTLQLLPTLMRFIINALLVLASTLWLLRSLGRSRYRYSKEKTSGSLRRQLEKLGVNWQKSLAGKSIEDLSTDEVYILAKFIPQFSQDFRRQIYQGILEEAVANSKTQSEDHLGILSGIRKQLKITEDEHKELLAVIIGKNLPILIPLQPQIQTRQLELQ